MSPTILAAAAAAKPRIMIARYPGRCAWCAGAIVPGDMIAYASDPRWRYVMHDACHADAYIAARDGGWR